MGKAQTRYFIVIGLLLITAVLSWKLLQSQPQPHEIRLDEFPMTVGSWQGKDIELSRQDIVYAVLETKTLLTRLYVNSEAKDEIIDFFVIYAERTSRGFHPPEVCFVAGGRTIVKAGIVPIPLSDEENAPILKANMFLGKVPEGQKILFLYWFGIGDRLMANYYKSSLYLLRDTIRGKNSPATMVRVALPLVNDDFEKTMAIATDFIQQIIPILPEYLTERVTSAP